MSINGVKAKYAELIRNTEQKTPLWHATAHVLRCCSTIGKKETLIHDLKIDLDHTSKPEFLYVLRSAIYDLEH